MPIENMPVKIKQLFSDNFYRNSAIFFIGSFTVAGLNYLYYPVISRLLSVEDYGIVQAITQIIFQTTILLNAFGYVVINILANNGDEGKDEVRDLEGTALTLVCLLSFFLLLFSGPIIRYLKFPSILPLIAVSGVMILNVPYVIKTGWLQAKKRFGQISIAGIISAVSKLMIAVFFILLGLRIGGVVLGFIGATLLSLFYVTVKANSNIKLSHHFGQNYLKHLRQNKKLRQDIYFAFYIFLVLISVAILYSADVIFMRRYFSTTEAGLYAGISTVAGILFFATLSISNVLLPNIRMSDPEKNRQNLFKAISIIGFLGFSGLTIIYFFPRPIISLLMGQKYLPLAGLLPKVAFFDFLAALINLFFLYLVSLRKKFIALIAASGILGLISINYFRHNSIEMIIQNFIIINAAVLTLTIIYLLAQHYNGSKPKLSNRSY